MKINILLFFTAFNVIHTTHTMDNPPRHELSQQLYKKIEKALFSNSDIKELKKILPNKKSSKLLSPAQKNRLINKSNEQLQLLEKNLYYPKKIVKEFFFSSLVYFTLFVIGITVILVAASVGDINRCSNYCLYDSECKRLHYHYECENKEWVDCQKFCDQKLDHCTELCIQKAVEYDTNNDVSLKIFGLYAIFGSFGMFLKYLKNNPPKTPKDIIKFFQIYRKKSKLKNKISYLENMFLKDKCCICYKKNALNGNIPCKLKHPNDAICNNCLKKIDRCPLCRGILR